MKHTLLIKVCSFLSLLTCLLGLASLMSSHSVFAQRNSLPPAQRFLSSGSSDWTMFDFHDSRFNAQERTLNTTNVSQLSLAWSTALTKMSGGPTIEMVVADGIVYTTSLRVSGHNALVAVREQTGTVLWQHTLPSKDGPMGGHYYLSFADGLVYLNGAASLEAYTAATGTLRWSRAIDPEYGINVEHGVLYVESSLGYPQGQSSVYALDAHTGKTLWSVVLAQNLYSSSPALASGILYVGSVDGTLLALNATNGHTLWTASLGTNNAIITAPVVDHGIVFVEGDSTGLFAFNATTGKERWFAPSNPYTGSPAVAYGMVYVPAGPLLAYDELSGKLIWRGEGGAPDESASVANGVVYANSGEGPLALDAHTGKLLYLYTNTPYQGQSNSSSVVANGMVFFMMSYGYIDALKLP